MDTLLLGFIVGFVLGLALGLSIESVIRVVAHWATYSGR